MSWNKRELFNSEDVCTIKFTFAQFIKKTNNSIVYLNVIEENGKNTVKSLSVKERYFDYVSISAFSSF